MVPAAEKSKILVLMSDLSLLVSSFTHGLGLLVSTSCSLYALL